MGGFVRKIVKRGIAKKVIKPVAKPVLKTPDIIIRNLRAQAEFEILTEKKRQEELRRFRLVKVLTKEE